MKLKIRKGAKVEVISGADKGKKGTVIEVQPKLLKIKIQGVRIQTHFDKKEGMKTIEGYLDYSKVKLLENAPEAKAKKSSKKKAGASKSA